MKTFWLFCLTALSLQLIATSLHARDTRQAQIREVTAADLPKQARDTLALIKKGGPFPYPKDGIVFGNFERQLPPKPRGYYHEYTVPTPGSRDRGARRIVAGDRREYYYTADHYKTFLRIRQ
jgi:ribonuclease T1